ncbi:hypothetical protein BACCOPRO_00576 [Phocaeicola coprophilus DSM 18228 = JCM 13818]|uniref:Uncharacterized protein n=1 Tax=Phocaeicola coprophilus DSM 18228 = JCM 13818 TaxID=547042 RepID=S0F4M3_9BACT|nr:hypothetical protein BACCOPRO_00576 [Phocaeicola coprophilus DSM 18228 = JCM 13818]
MKDKDKKLFRKGFQWNERVDPFRKLKSFFYFIEVNVRTGAGRFFLRTEWKC